LKSVTSLVLKVGQAIQKSTKNEWFGEVKGTQERAKCSIYITHNYLLAFHSNYVSYTVSKTYPKITSFTLFFLHSCGVVQSIHLLIICYYTVSQKDPDILAVI